MSDDTRVPVSYDDAAKMLPDEPWVHTFRNSSGVLLGADWSKVTLLAWIKKNGVELAGEMATSMKHGLVGFDNHGPLFIETSEVPHE